MNRFTSAWQNREVLLHALQGALLSGLVVVAISVVIDLVTQLFLDEPQRAYILLAENLGLALVVTAICFIRGMLAHRQDCVMNAYALSKRAREFQIRECLDNIVWACHDEKVHRQIRLIKALIGGEGSTIPEATSEFVRKMGSGKP